MPEQLYQPPDGRGLIFIQPSRSAGNAFMAILQESFGTESCFKIGIIGDSNNTYQDFLRVVQKDELSLYGGHFCFGVHQHILRPCDYVVSLRHPVERLLSRYEARCRVLGHSIDWGDWLENDFESNNGIIKRLLGVAYQDDQSIIFDINEGREFVGTMEVGEDQLQSALDVIDTRVSCVLFKDYFEESLLRLGTMFAMPPLFSLHRQFINHAQVPTRTESYPPEIVDEISARNAYDIRLYEKCLGDFEDFLARQDAAFHHEVRIMKILSAILMDSETQILDEGSLIGRFFNTINEMLRAGQTDDAVDVINRFTTSPYIGVAFHRGILRLLHAIGAVEALNVEIDKYVKHFGADPFVDALKQVQE